MPSQGSRDEQGTLNQRGTLIKWKYLKQVYEEYGWNKGRTETRGRGHIND